MRSGLKGRGPRAGRWLRGGPFGGGTTRSQRCHWLSREERLGGGASAAELPKGPAEPGRRSRDDRHGGAGRGGDGAVRGRGLKGGAGRRGAGGRGGYGHRVKRDLGHLASSHLAHLQPQVRSVGQSRLLKAEPLRRGMRKTGGTRPNPEEVPEVVPPREEHAGVASPAHTTETFQTDEGVASRRVTQGELTGKPRS